MAIISNPTLFFPTSPRSPLKMRPEMKLLVEKFKGRRWERNRALQKEFAKELSSSEDFKGTASESDPDFSARDRITRGPKSLGLVTLDVIGFTEPGLNFYDEDLATETFLRQLMKFQLPSPFHVIGQNVKKTFCVRPYLEILRLIHRLGRLAFDELMLFGMQLTDYRDFECVVEDIRKFRIAKEQRKGAYKKFFAETKVAVVKSVFSREISEGRIKTRESDEASLDKFIQTKSGTMRDYADACVRYIHASGLVTVSSPGRTLSLIESKRAEAEYLLATVDRNPVFVDDYSGYRKHLYNPSTPLLLTDDRASLVDKAVKCNAVKSKSEAASLTIKDLKKRIRVAEDHLREAVVMSQATELKSFSKYDDVVEVFRQVQRRDKRDRPLMFEWNAWRTMTMMDGGSIRANLTFDDAGNPLSTAPGNNADIVCDYGDFVVTVEVTLMSGNKQYDAEGEPVARHLGDIKAKTGRPAYCLFVAPTINENVIAHFFVLHKVKAKSYGGKSVVIPLTLDRFVGMLTQSKNCGYVPSPDKVRSFCEYSMMTANATDDAETWYSAISKKADDWLN